MKSFLNNKLAVIFLSALALVLVGNTIRTYLVSNQPYQAPDDFIDPLVDMLPDEIDSLSMGAAKKDSQAFKNMDWPSFPRRNPFQPYKVIENTTVTHVKTTITKKPVQQVSNSKATPVLTAIIINKDSKLAVINTQVASVGESIDGYKINNIYKNRVNLSGPDGPLVINLIESIKDEPNEKSL